MSFWSVFVLFYKWLYLKVKMLRVFERKDVWIKRDKLMVLWFIFFLIIYIYDWFVYIVVEKKIWKKKFSRLKN